MFNGCMNELTVLGICLHTNAHDMIRVRVELSLPVLGLL